MFNHYQRAGQQYLFDMLKDRYGRNQNICERITHHLVTEQDVKEFAQLIADLFEQGFFLASSQYKKHLENLGYDVSVGKSKT